MSGVYECEVYKDTTKTTVTVEGEVFAAYTVDKWDCVSKICTD